MKGRYLIIAFFFAQVMDIVSTYFGIHSFDLMEANPVASTLFGKLGMTEVMILKLVLTYSIILLYALSIGKFKVIASALEKSLQIASVSTWGIVGLNFFGMFSSTFLH